MMDQWQLLMRRFFKEMKKRYGKETLQVKEDDEEWYCSVEQERKERLQTEQDKIASRDYAETCGNENSDITVGKYSRLYHR